MEAVLPPSQMVFLLKNLKSLKEDIAKCLNSLLKGAREDDGEEDDSAGISTSSRGRRYLRRHFQRSPLGRWVRGW